MPFVFSFLHFLCYLLCLSLFDCVPLWDTKLTHFVSVNYFGNIVV